MQIIKKHQNWLKVESFQGVIKSIIGSMYENIVNDEIFEKDLIFLIGDVIELIVKSKEHFYEYNFNENSLPCEILKQFTQKLEFMNYAKQITRSTLL